MVRWMGGLFTTMGGGLLLSARPFGVTSADPVGKKESGVPTMGRLNTWVIAVVVGRAALVGRWMGGSVVTSGGFLRLWKRLNVVPRNVVVGNLMGGALVGTMRRKSWKAPRSREFTGK